MRKDFSDHIPVYINRIQYLEQQLSNMTEVDRKLSIYDEIVGLSGLALGKINQNELLKFFGEKHHDPVNSENKK